MMEALWIDPRLISPRHTNVLAAQADNGHHLTGETWPAGASLALGSAVAASDALR